MAHSSSSKWVVLPTYSWEEVIKDAVLVSRLKDLYSKRTRTSKEVLFPWEVRCLLGDVFTLPGRETGGSGKVGSNLLDLPVAARKPIPAVISQVVFRVKDVIERAPPSTLDQANVDVALVWLNVWTYAKAQEAKCTELHSEMLQKRLAENKIVKERKAQIEAVLSQSEGRQPSSDSTISAQLTEPIAPAAAPASKKPIQPTTPLSRSNVKKTVIYAQPKTVRYAQNQLPIANDASSRILGSGDVQEDTATAVLDKLRKTAASLCRIEKVIDSEEENVVHHAKTLGLFARGLIAVFIASSLIAGISGDGFSIMINFFTAGVIACLGVVAVAVMGKVSIVYFTILAMIVAIFLYPIYLALRVTLYNNDPEAPINRWVIAMTIVIEALLFLIAVYSASITGTRQRVQAALVKVLHIESEYKPRKTMLGKDEKAKAGVGGYNSASGYSTVPTTETGSV